MLVYLTISILFLTSVVFAFYFIGLGLFAELSHLPHSSVAALLIEAAIVVLIFFFTYALSKRKRYALVLVTFLYLAFLTASVVKTIMLGAPIFPSDTILIGDLVRTWDVFIVFVPYLLVFAALIGLFSWYEFKRSEPDKLMGSGIFVLLLVIFVSTLYVKNDRIRLFLRDHGVVHMVNGNVTKQSFESGLLVSFVQALMFSGKPNPPEGYSAESIQALYQKYQLDIPTQAGNSPTNVIVLLVEAFTNPNDFGIQLNQSPIPAFQSIVDSHATGHVLSPVYGGKSINAEFELMTGMTNLFNPAETTPYKEFIEHNIPSLARAFKHNGYTTNAVQMIPLKGFGYTKIYDYLGVDNKIGLNRNHKGVISDPSGRSVSSETSAATIINLTREQDKSFIFAFPNSTHSPWHLKHYPESSIELIDSPLHVVHQQKLKAYFSALNHVDLLFDRLISEYENSDENTLIVIVGDHQPGIKYYANELTSDSEINSIKNKYLTAFGIWSNYPSSQDKDIRISMNLVPAQIIKQAGIQVRGFMKFMTVLREHYAMISLLYKKTGGPYTTPPKDELDPLIKDYQLFQYDLLFGDNHLSRLSSKH